MSLLTKQIVELLPILIFVIANFKYGIKVGFITFLILAPVCMVIYWLSERKITLLQWLGALVVSAISGMAYLGEDSFYSINGRLGLNSYGASQENSFQLEKAIERYGKRVSAKIGGAISYPTSLLQERGEGTVELGLVLNQRGKLEEVVMISSSSNITIDEAAIATVRSIKFSTPPKGSNLDDLRFGIKMEYVPPPIEKVEAD